MDESGSLVPVGNHLALGGALPGHSNPSRNMLHDRR